MNIDWDSLVKAASEILEDAYAPYSKFHVGAAALVDDGRVVTGCNVENASYGLTLCAECGVITQLHASGGGRLVAIACRAQDRAHNGEIMPVMPCGRCRQLLLEAGGPKLLVDGDGTARYLEELLPYHFTIDSDR